MRILLLGASGFIGRELFAALTARGHAVVPVVRRPSGAPPFAGEPAIRGDLARDVDPAAWIPRLHGIDAVVNCAGILQERGANSNDAVHHRGPAALYRACEDAGVRRVVLISAISAHADARTRYATTKLAGEEALRASRLEWVVLRPSLVHARGAYGGTALFRGMAALPFLIPVPAGAGHAFQPIHVDDLARVVAKALESAALVGRTLDPVGPDVVTLREILVDYRRWLGLPGAPLARIPAWLVACAARMGDLAGGPLNSTALAQMRHGNTGDYAAFADQSGITCAGWHESLAANPAHTQDRWHARLYFVRPLLRTMLALLWLASGLAGFLAVGDWTPRLVASLGIANSFALVLLIAACVCDLAIGALLVARWRPRALAGIQVAVIAAYTIAATAMEPGLWFAPLGPLLKNLPIVAAALALGAIEEER